jgi:PAS domain S-box-containing protein
VQTFGGVTTSNTAGLPVVVIYAALLRGWRSAALYAAIAVLGSCVLAVGTLQGFIPPSPYPPAVGASTLGVVLNLAAAIAASFLAERQRRGAQQAAERASRVAQLNQERLDQLIDESPDGLAWFDARGRLMEANPAFSQMCGRSPTRLVGQAVGQLDRFTSESRIEAVRAMERLAGGEPEQHFGLRGEPGRECIVEVTARRVRLPGAKEAFQWNARDVTEREAEREARERLAVELREARRLEDIGRLAGGVAHDFNNLLTAVNANAQLLGKEASLPERGRKQLDVITQAGERAAALTQQLLAFARRQVLAPQPVELGEAIRGMTTLLEQMLGESIRLRLELGTQPIWVEVDSSRLEQVITNLAINGRDAMHDGGALTIDLGRVFLGDHPVLAPGPYARLRVSDSGVGMDAATAARVFEPFFTTKSETKGTGLGLATVHGIVRQSGGQISVQSEKGEGTTFEVTLPEIEPPRQVEPAPTLEVTPAPVDVGGTVLVVDDEPLVRQTVESVLELSGFDVLAANGPEEAAHLMCNVERQLDLLVTDVVMPGESGPELAMRLRTRWPSLRVIFMSGYADDLNTGRWQVVPPSHYLQKPFTPGALRALVAEVMASSSASGLSNGTFDE